MSESNPKNIGEPISGNLAVCAFVQKSHLFKKVDQMDIDLVFQAGRIYRIDRGDLIIREGDRGERFYLIFQGTMKVFVNNDNQQVELSRLSRGALFGEIAFLTGKPRTASVVSLEAAEIIGFRRNDLRHLMRKYPHIEKLLQTTMKARAAQAIDKTLP